MNVGLYLEHKLIRSEIEIFNGGDFMLFRRGDVFENDVRRVRLTARFEAGNFRLIIGESLRTVLRLDIVDNRRLQRASGEENLSNVAEFVELKFENRRMTTQPFVLPDVSGAILGAFIINDLDVVIDFERQNLAVNPKSRLAARKYLK